MTNAEIVSSWKHGSYASHFSAADQALIPANPAGMTELSDDELMGVSGADAELSIAIVTIAVIVITA